jgi:hypothetical protein
VDENNNMNINNIPKAIHSQLNDKEKPPLHSDKRTDMPLQYPKHSNQQSQRTVELKSEPELAGSDEEAAEVMNEMQTLNVRPESKEGPRVPLHYKPPTSLLL